MHGMRFKVWATPGCRKKNKIRLRGSRFNHEPQHEAYTNENKIDKQYLRFITWPFLPLLDRKTNKKTAKVQKLMMQHQQHQMIVHEFNQRCDSNGKEIYKLHDHHDTFKRWRNLNPKMLKIYRIYITTSLIEWIQCWLPCQPSGPTIVRSSLRPTSWCTLDVWCSQPNRLLQLSPGV